MLHRTVLNNKTDLKRKKVANSSPSGLCPQFPPMTTMSLSVAPLPLLQPLPFIVLLTLLGMLTTSAHLLHMYQLFNFPFPLFILAVSTKLVHPYETYDPNDQIAEESLDVPQTIVSPFEGKVRAGCSHLLSSQTFQSEPTLYLSLCGYYLLSNPIGHYAAISVLECIGLLLLLLQLALA